METFALPHGGSVQMHVRDGTNDWNVAYSILTEDEYRIDALRPMTGTALDVGAHIGAATVALCALNPDLRVVAIEALPANVELLRLNTEPYADRVTIINAAAGTNGEVGWNWTGDETSTVHRFIGNQYFDPSTGHDTLTVPTVSLSEIVAEHGPIRFLKIDIEGAEREFLDDPALDAVESIAGEWHHGPKVRLFFDKSEIPALRAGL